MNVTQVAKDAALAARPGAVLVRVGKRWVAVWREGKLWVGQPINSVAEGNVIWWGVEDRATTKRALVKGLLETQ